MRDERLEVRDERLEVRGIGRVTRCGGHTGRVTLCRDARSVRPLYQRLQRSLVLTGADAFPLDTPVRPYGGLHVLL